MAIKTKIKLEDNTQEWQQEFIRKVQLALEVLGNTAEGYAKEDCPVDTGRLRNSISYKPKEKTVYIGTNVEYAPIQEFKDLNHSVGKAHFLRDAVGQHNNEYQNIIKDVMEF